MGREVNRAIDARCLQALEDAMNEPGLSGRGVNWGEG